MYKMTLRGPKTTTIVSSEDTLRFKKYQAWIEEYNPAENADLSVYPIKTEARMVASRIKARKLGLQVV